MSAEPRALVETTLDQVPLNAIATVLELTSEGPERRRMLDLGIVPGTRVEVALLNPLGDPTGYRVRGAVVALRREQARRIRVQMEGSETG